MYHDSENSEENQEDNSVGVSVHAGFPNAAEDHVSRALDFNALLVRHPVSTYCFRVEGNAYEDRGIFGGDIAVIDRALSPRLDDLVLHFTDDNFVLAEFRKLHKTEIWGVVTSIIHRVRV